MVTAGTDPAQSASLDPALKSAGTLVLYDGVCGLCNRFVQFVLCFDRRRRFRFATIQGVHGDAARQRFAALRDVDSIVYLTANRAAVKSDAVLEIVQEMGGIWIAAIALRVVPRVLRDLVYDAVARRRYRVFGRFDVCPVPSPATRERFLD